MLQLKKLSFLGFLIFFLLPILSAPQVALASLASTLAGQILLDVERNGEAWYIYPDNNRRYYLGRPADAFRIMRELGLGITEENFHKIPEAGEDLDEDRHNLGLTKKLAGKIILQVEKNGEAWYIYPKDLRKYYLGRPNDAFAIMRELSLGITRENLARIHKPELEESIDDYSNYRHAKINTSDGVFSAEIVEINLAAPFLKIRTLAAEPHPTADKRTRTYGGKTLGSFVLENNGFAGINGTYFCSHSGCGGANYYFYPLYDSNKQVFINQNELKYWTTGPIIAFDEDNKFYYFKDSRIFPYQDWYKHEKESLTEAFEKTYGKKLQATIGNRPRLIEDYMNYVIEWDIDDKQDSAKAVRNAIAYKDNKVYLVAVYNATIHNLANVLKAMEVEYALNLDGGGSSAVWYNDEYMIGPGRNIPNAIIFSIK